MSGTEIAFAVIGAAVGVITLLLAVFGQSRKSAREQSATLTRIEEGVSYLRTDVSEIKQTTSKHEQRIGALEVITAVHQVYLSPHQFANQQSLPGTIINNNPAGGAA